MLLKSSLLWYWWRWRALCGPKRLCRSMCAPQCYPVFAVALLYLISLLSTPDNPLLNLDTKELITHHGYLAETHKVVTPDGYVLTMHRIVSKLGSRASSASSADQRVRRPGAEGRKLSPPPIILLHGFTCSSSMWVFRGPNADLAFQLSNEGFDVWLPNLRGNSYTELTPTASRAFNDFSFHEMGTLDLPTLIEEVLEKTGHQRVGLVGHSMGTTVILSGLAVNPEYNDKISHVALLAPVTVRDHLTEFLHVMMKSLFLMTGELGNDAMDRMGVFSRGAANMVWARIVARMPAPIKAIVNFFWRWSTGINTSCTIAVPTEVLSAHVPDAMTHRTLLHYYMNMLSGEFRMRDYGVTENIVRYNATKPPLYDVTQISVPVSAYLGNADVISPPKDFLATLPQYTTPIKVNVYEGYNHIDLIWSEEVSHQIFPKIVKEFRRTVRESVSPKNLGAHYSSNAVIAESDETLAINVMAEISVLATTTRSTSTRALLETIILATNFSAIENASSTLHRFMSRVSLARNLQIEKVSAAYLAHAAFLNEVVNVSPKSVLLSKNASSSYVSPLNVLNLVSPYYKSVSPVRSSSSPNVSLAKNIIPVLGIESGTTESIESASENKCTPVKAEKKSKRIASYPRCYRRHPYSSVFVFS